MLIVAAVAFLASRRARERGLEGKRVEATELRGEAQVQSRRAEERESLAEQQAEQARRERAAAEERVRRADDVDPDVET